VSQRSDVVTEALAAAWTPEPKLTVSEWADQHRMLTGKSSAEPGHWRTERTPYLREIMDALSPSHPAQRVVFVKGSQLGGPLALDTPIPTPDGWTTMGEIRVGDQVFDEGGQVRSVTYVSPVMLGHRCYEIRFSDRTSIIADAEHRWAVDDDIHGQKRIKRRVLTTQEIAATYRHGKNRNRYAIPITRPLDLPERELPIAPYALGAWLGDGNGASNQITAFEDDAGEIGQQIAAGGHRVVVRRPQWIKGRCMNLIIEPALLSGICRRGHDKEKVGVYRVLKRGKPAERCAECARQAAMAAKYGRARDPVVRAPSFFSRLQTLGLVRNKRIPETYLRASSEQRMDLLRGLMDTDGTITKTGWCSFDSADLCLVADVLDLLRGLGFKPALKIREGRGFSGKTETSTMHHSLGFQAYDDRPVFALRRKRERMRNRLTGRPTEAERRRIVEVQPFASVPVRCIAVDAPSHLYLAGAGMIPTHNTEAGSNWLGYIIHHAPAPTLILLPTVEVARRFSRQRLDPAIRGTPVLRERVREARSRDSGNTMTSKEFPGGIVILTGANSAAGLKSMPIRYLFCDEVDEYPGDVEGQGDPVGLAEKRTTTFPRRKVFLVSTPTTKHLSRIEKEYLASDQRRYFVPCPACGRMDWIRWENIRWEPNEPKTARLVCVGCGVLIEEHHKPEMLARGEWRATAASDTGTVGFHVSSLYSPLGWRSWPQCVGEFLAGKEDPYRLKTWVNTILGETWEERGDSADPNAILERAERYAAEVPNGVGVLVASVDVQGDRLEAQVKGYGASEESWLIAHTQIHGDPGREKVWHELDAFLKQPFTHESGRKIHVECVAVDSGGHHSEEVYRFCKLRSHRRVLAVRGGNERGKPVVGEPTRHNRYRTPLFTLCTDTAKEIVMARLRISAAGPGYCHLPEWVDEEYVAQLTAEKAVRKYVKGRGTVREWVKTRERNEALDLEVYCLAALYILGPHFVKSLPERAARLAVPVPKGGETKEPEPARRAPRDPAIEEYLRRRNSWVHGWSSGTGRWVDGWI